MKSKYVWDTQCSFWWVVIIIHGIIWRRASAALCDGLPSWAMSSNWNGALRVHGNMWQVGSLRRKRSEELQAIQSKIEATLKAKDQLIELLKIQLQVHLTHSTSDVCCQSLLNLVNLWNFSEILLWTLMVTFLDLLTRCFWICVYAWI